MPYSEAVDSRVLLRACATRSPRAGGGQERLDRIVRLIAHGLVAEVCSVYLRREDQWLELCATEGLKPEAVHQTRLKVGQGLVGRIADSAEPINTPDARGRAASATCPRPARSCSPPSSACRSSGSARCSACWWCRTATPREYTDDEVYALEVVAMVLAEMTELGAFAGPRRDGDRRASTRLPFFGAALVGQEGAAEGTCCLHEPASSSPTRSPTTPTARCARLHAAIERAARSRSTRCSRPTT